MQRRRQVLVDESLLVAILAIYAAARLALLPGQISQDGWLMFVAGREVVEHGLPAVDHLTVVTTGTRWVDQQWLGQLIFYGVARVTTIKGALGLHALLVISSLGAALVAARALGGTSRHTARIVALALPSVLVATWFMRTQSLAYGLFVALMWLLIADARSPSRRVWLVVPLLAMWTNIHGSALLGIGLVGLWSLTRVAGPTPPRIRLDELPRAAAVAGAACACLVASPYGVDLLAYYRDTVGNGEFGTFVSEWRAPTPGLGTAPVYVLAFATASIVARHGRRLTTFEWLALTLLLIGALMAIRNVVWLALAAIIILPSAFRRSGDADAEDAPARVRELVVLAAGAILVAGLTSFLMRPASAITAERYPPALARAVAAVSSKPSARVYANERYADWLLWLDPSLAGRVAYDARFELLGTGVLSRLYRFQNQVGPGWEKHANGYDVLVLPREVGVDLDGVAPTYEALLDAGGFRVAYRDAESVVLTRTD